MELHEGGKSVLEKAHLIGPQRLPERWGEQPSGSLGHTHPWSCTPLPKMFAGSPLFSPDPPWFQHTPVLSFFQIWTQTLPPQQVFWSRQAGGPACFFSEIPLWAGAPGGLMERRDGPSTQAAAPWASSVLIPGPPAPDRQGKAKGNPRPSHWCCIGDRGIETCRTNY